MNIKAGWNSVGGVHAAYCSELEKHPTSWVIPEETCGFWNNSDGGFVFRIFQYLLSLISGGRKLTCGEIWETTVTILAKRE